MSPNGLGGAVVTKDGELVSVFKHPDSKEDITPVLEEASLKATHGDCYDLHGYLPDLYGKFGFAPVARVAFDPKLAPAGWDEKTMDAPNVVMLVKTGSYVPLMKYDQMKNQIPLMRYDEARKMQANALKRITEQEGDRKYMEGNLTDIARKNGFEGKVSVVREPPRWFTVGDKKFQEAAHFDPKDRSIQANFNMVTPDFEKGLMAHEVMHDKWHVVQAENEREAKEIMNLPEDEWKRLFRMSGEHRDEAATAEIEKRWPVSALFAKTWGSGSSGYAKGSKDRRAQMQDEDGVSDYSRAYWNSDRTYDTKINETLAEIARLHSQGSPGLLVPSPLPVRAQLRERGYTVTKGFDGKWHVTNQDGSAVVTRKGSRVRRLIDRVNEPDPVMKGDTRPSDSWERLYQGVNKFYDQYKNKPAPSTAEPVVKEGIRDLVEDSGYSPTEKKYLAEFRQKQRDFVKTTGKLGLRYDADLKGPPLPEKEMAEYIAMVANHQHNMMMSHAKEGSGIKYGGTADFLQHEGEWFDVPDSAPQIKLMTPKECYANAANMAINHPSQYQYVEGYYASNHLPMPIDHAWLVDRKTGKVVDPTLGWQPNSRYFGVAYSNTFLHKKLLQNKYYGLHSNGIMMNDIVLGKDKDFKYGQRDIGDNK